VTGSLVALGTGGVLLASFAGATTPAAEQPASDQVTLCHATGSATNPYVEITIDAAGAYNGHYRIHEDDVIPAFTYNGMNLTAKGNQALLKTGCKAVTPTSTTTTTSNDKVTLCHATGSATNPYVEITVDAAGAYNGHYRIHEDDVIPPFTYNGMNLTAKGNQALLKTGCKAVTPTSTTTTTSTSRTTTTKAPPNDRVTLCHATGSATNPYVEITVDAAGAYNGHYRIHEDDVIPPFTYNGMNLTAKGHQALLNTGCKAVTPTTTSSTTSRSVPAVPGGGSGGNGPAGPVPGGPVGPGNGGAAVQGPGSGGGNGAGQVENGQSSGGSGSATSNGSSSGPIPNGVNAGQQAVSEWQLPLGVALIALGASGLLVLPYLRKRRAS